jgi:phosphatidate cytidylyltransferase
MLKLRIITVIWAIPLVILTVWFSRPEFAFPFLTLLVAMAGLLALYEFYHITGVLKNLPLTVFGMVWTLLFIVRPHCSYSQSLPVLLTGGIVLSLMMLVFLRQKEGVFNLWAWMTGGALYLGWLLSLLMSIRLDFGRNWIYLALLATFASDTLAYFIGKSFGRHKLAPAISPGKTWEGAVAGVIGAIIVSLFFILPTELQLPINWGQAIILGLFVSIVGQIGDLAESLLKRNTGVKDSGTIMPGHGGLMDRMDSILFAGVVVYFFILAL